MNAAMESALRQATELGVPGFPKMPIQNGAARCAYCLNMHMLCNCEDVEYGKDYLLSLPSRPSSEQTPDQNFRPWVSIIQVHPTAAIFNASRFYNDNRSLPETLQRVKPQLEGMMAEYKAQLKTDPKRPGLLQCAKQGGIQAADLPAYFDEQLRKLLACDFSRMSRFDLLIINNAFQNSDPEKYDTGDASLMTVFQCVMCLNDVAALAYTNLSLRFEDNELWLMKKHGRKDV